MAIKNIEINIINKSLELDTLYPITLFDNNILSNDLISSLNLDEGSTPSQMIAKIIQSINNVSNTGVAITYSSYIGTGEYGVGASKTLTFPFTPIYVVIEKPLSNRLILLRNNTESITERIKESLTSGANYVQVSWSNKSVTWICNFKDHAEFLMNYNNMKYYYVGIGIK